MPSRHHLLADLEDKRRKKEEECVEVVSWEPAPTGDASGYDPYDNPGAGKTTDATDVAGKRGRKKR